MNSNMTNQQSSGNGDMLDKGVDYLERKSGHEQVSVLQPQL